MTVSRGLYVRQVGTVGTTPLEARRALAGILAETTPGVPRTGLLVPSVASVVTGTTDMSYDVAACTPVINRAAGEGVYVFGLTGTTNTGPVTAAPGTGSRWDLIYVKQNDPDKGDPDNLAVLAVVIGTAAANPVKPTASVPPGAMILAEALVNAGATGTNDPAFVTITNVYLQTCARGGLLPVRNATERNAITAVGTRVRRLDTGAQEERTAAGWTVAQSSVGVDYAPGWSGASNWGTGNVQRAKYWRDGDRVRVQAMIQAGTANTSLGANAIGFNLPPGLPLASDYMAIGAGTVNTANTGGFNRHVDVLAGPGQTSATVWAIPGGAERVVTPGAAGYPFVNGSSIHVQFEYRTSAA